MKKLPNMFQDFKSMEGDRNPATSKRKGSEVSEASSDDDLQLPKRKKRFSSINDSNPATSKRKGSEDSVSSDDELRQAKRAKRLSSTNDRNPATSSKRKHREVLEPSSDDDLRQSKRFVPERATNIHDIPEELLVEILCRLPSAESVFQCKSVSKNWRSLTSKPYFIGRFLWVQRQNQTPIPATIINMWVEEIHPRDMFAAFRSSKAKEIGILEVHATCNDLLLCRPNRELGDSQSPICKRFCRHDDGQYCICNPRTMQHVNLPWIHECDLDCDPIVGFICEPYYKEEEEQDDGHGDSSTDQKEEEKKKVIRIDAEYRFKVVRILPPEDPYSACGKFKIQVFSSEIGEWRESEVSCRYKFEYSDLMYDIPEHTRGAFGSNGMLYWISKDSNMLVGLGPLMINDKSSTACSNSTAAESADCDSGYQLYVIDHCDADEDEDEDEHEHDADEDEDVDEVVDVDVDVPRSLYHFQSHCGRLQWVRMVGNKDGNGAKLFVWELKKEELEQMAVQGGGEVGRRHRKVYSIMEGEHYDKRYTTMEYFGSDNLDAYFVRLTDHNHFGSIKTGYKCNIHTGSCSEIEMRTPFSGLAIQIMLPWWPTPVPKVCSRAAETSPAIK